MIERVEGEILEVGGSHLLIGLGGIGVRVLVPRSVAMRFEAGTIVRLWTRLIVRDGEPQLYGFAETAERSCFDALLAVSGVGARIALAVLSTLDPGSLTIAVESGAIEPLLSVPGVGRKLASRVVLELRGRLPGGDVPTGSAEPGMNGLAPGQDAIRALTSLGYPAPEARDVVARILRDSATGPPPLDSLLRTALVELNRAKP